MIQKYQKYIFAVILALLVLAGGFYFFRDRLALAIMDRVLTQNMMVGDALPLDDGLHIALCGAGGPMPDQIRSGPCIAVLAGKRMFVVDAGSHGGRNLTRMRWATGRIDAVLLTHFHSDHIDGLGELAMLRWTTAGHKAPLPVFGPRHIENRVENIVAGFNLAYRADAGYRTAHHGQDIAPSSGAGLTAKVFDLPAPRQLVILWDKDGVKISAFKVEHDPVDPAVGYKFEYKNRSIIISGDTKKSANVEFFARNADLLIHEALSPELVGIITKAAEKAGNKRIVKITKDILDYHTTPVEAAHIAQKANVRHLLYYHIVPPMPLFGLESIFLRGVESAFDKGITLGRDGTSISLPAGSDDVIVKELF